MNKQNYELSTTVWYQLICITAELNTVYKWCGSIASVCFALINTLNIYGIIKRTKYATIVQASYLLKAAVICITLFIRHLLHTMEIQFDGHWKKNEKKNNNHQRWRRKWTRSHAKNHKETSQGRHKWFPFLS